MGIRMTLSTVSTMKPFIALLVAIIKTMKIPKTTQHFKRYLHFPMLRTYMAYAQHQMLKKKAKANSQE